MKSHSDGYHVSCCHWEKMGQSQRLGGDVFSGRQDQPVWRSPGRMLVRALQECSEQLLLFLMENVLREKIKPKISPSNSIMSPTREK